MNRQDNLRDEKLHNIVRNALQMQIQIVMEEAEFVESIRQAQQEPYRLRRIERQIRQLTTEKAHTQGIKEKLQANPDLRGTAGTYRPKCADSADKAGRVCTGNPARTGTQSVDLLLRTGTAGRKAE